MIEFIDDEDGYRAWISQHSGGFVVNCERVVRPAYLVLHRATCGHVSSPKHTNYTTKDYIKICADDVEELDSWAANEAGGVLSPCKACAPAATERETKSNEMNEAAVGALFTQRITEKDISRGIIRVTRAGKSLLPDQRSEVEVELRGVRTSCRWDPRYGPDRERSGSLAVGTSALHERVSKDEKLRMHLDGGVIYLD